MDDINLIKRKVESLDKWELFKTELIEKGYKLWQMQYGYDSPEGFHAWFWKGNNQVEVVTYDRDVQKDIVSSELS